MRVILPVVLSLLVVGESQAQQLEQAQPRRSISCSVLKVFAFGKSREQLAADAAMYGLTDEELVRARNCLKKKKAT